MTGPKHLRSGDWRPESAAKADELARRRGEANPYEEPRPAEPAPPAAPASHPLRDAIARLKASLRRPRRPRVSSSVVIAIATLISAVLAYAIVSELVSPSSHSSQNSAQIPSHSQPTNSGGTGYLGVNTISFPLTNGALVLNVAAGSPAETAGLEPGDVITEINGRAVQTPAQLNSVLAGLHPGQQVQIGYDRGPMSLSAQATLTTRPAGP